MHVVVTQHFTVLKSFWVPFTGFSFGEKYFFFNSFESVFFPFVLSYSLIKFLPGACFKQRNETKQKQKTRNKIKGMWFMMIAKWTSSGGRGGWGEKREFSFWPFRDLTNYDGDGKENVKQAIGLISKTTTLHVHHAFLYISLLSLHNYDVKWPNFLQVCLRTGTARKLTISAWTRARSLLFNSNKNSFISDRANWDKREKV